MAEMEALNISNTTESSSNASYNASYNDSADDLLHNKKTKNLKRGHFNESKDPLEFKLKTTQRTNGWRNCIKESERSVKNTDLCALDNEMMLNTGINTRNQTTTSFAATTNGNTSIERNARKTNTDPDLSLALNSCEDIVLESDHEDNYGIRDNIGFVKSERQLLNNVLILSFASMLSVGAFQAIQNLDSSLFLESGIGVKALAIVYFFGALSVLYSRALVTRLGPNWTLGTSFCAIAIFISAHFYPKSLAVIPSSIFLGLLLGPLSSAQIHFLSQLTSRVVCLTTTIRDKLENRYHRLLHLLLSLSHIFGNLSLAIIFELGGKRSEGVYLYARQTLMAGRPTLQNDYGSKIYVDNVVQEAGLRLLPVGVHPKLCSAGLSQMCASSYFLNSNTAGYVFVLGPSLSYMLIGFFVGVTLIGVVVIIGLLHKFDIFIDQDPLERGLLSNSVRNVIRRAVRDNHLRLLLPMAFFIGLEQGFFAADFNKSYVSCALGLEAIGLVMMVRGVTHLIGSLLVHEFIQQIQRPLILAAGVSCQIGVLMILALWKPNDDIPIFYVIAFCWALAECIWETLALTNIIKTFAVEEWHYALIAFTGVQFMGLSLAFAASYYICQMIKIYTLAVVLPITALIFRLR